MHYDPNDGDGFKGAPGFPERREMMTELLPCPFCGCETIGTGYVRDGRSVFCTKCHASVRAFQPNGERSAIKLWNTRHAVAATLPNGYVLVPLIPTPAMVEVGCENNPTMWNDETDDGFAATVANDVYISMVRAAALAAPAPLATARDELLADINKAAHAAGTNAWVRDVLQRAHRAVRAGQSFDWSAVEVRCPHCESWFEPVITSEVSRAHSNAPQTGE